MDLSRDNWQQKVIEVISVSDLKQAGDFLTLKQDKW